MASMRSEGSPLEGDRPYMSERLMIHNRDRDQYVGVGPVNYGLLDNHNFAHRAQVPKKTYSLSALEPLYPTPLCTTRAQGEIMEECAGLWKWDAKQETWQKWSMWSARRCGGRDRERGGGKGERVRGRRDGVSCDAGRQKNTDFGPDVLKIYSM